MFRAAKRKPDRARPQETSLKGNKCAFASRARCGRRWREKFTMATLLSRIFGKKTVEPGPTQSNDDLDIRALKPLIEQKPVTSTDPKDLSGAWTMQQVTTVFPSAQRALFQKYHVGGCSSCGFQPTDTLSSVAMNHGLDTDEVIEHIQRSQELEKDIEITPQDTAALLKQGKIKLLDVRTTEEYAIASVPGSMLVDQSLAQEIIQTW